jgi:hypothetical protein
MEATIRAARVSKRWPVIIQSIGTRTGNPIYGHGDRGDIAKRITGEGHEPGTTWRRPPAGSVGVTPTFPPGPTSNVDPEVDAAGQRPAPQPGLICGELYEIDA